MSLSTAGPAWPAASAGSDAVRSDDDRVAFWISVAVALVFSQFWVMFLTGPGSATANTADVVDPAVSATVRNFYLPIYMVVLWQAASRFVGVGAALLRSPSLTLLLLVTFASMFWTIDPDVTLRRAIAVLLTSLAGVVIAERFTWPRFLEVFATAFAVLVVFCFIFALLLPSYGKMAVEFPGAWRGVWGHKNLLGYNMSVGFTVLVAAAIANPRRRRLWLAFTAGTIVLMLLSTSKTSLVASLIGCCCVLLVAVARRGPAGAAIAIFVGGSALMGLLTLIYAAPDALLGLVGKDATLTGRTQIWAAVMHQIEKRPLTGYGYGAVWDSTSLWGPLPWISKEQGFTIHEAHNTWLGIWLELGYIGLVVWAMLFVGMWLRAVWGVFFKSSAYFAMPFLVVFSLHTLTESAALAQNDLIWLIFCAVAVKLALPERSRAVQMEPQPRPQPYRAAWP